jgi:hypothetical protein
MISSTPARWHWLLVTLTFWGCGEGFHEMDPTEVGAEAAADTEVDAEVDTQDELATVESELTKNLPFSNGFETGTLQGWKCSGNCPTVTTAPIATGKFSGNFVLTRNLNTPYRTEATAGINFRFGQNYTMSMRYRYEDFAKDSSAEAAPFQIHTTPSTWEGTCNIGSAMSTAPFLMASQNDQVRFVTYGGKTMFTLPLERKKWLDVTVRFRISTGADGFVEVYRSGVKMGRVNGRNSPDHDACGKPMKEPYFKMGIYKWDWKAGRKATESTRRQLFIDDVMISEI